MNDTRFSNLLFLSGLAAVGLGGCDLGDDDSETAASTSATATASASDSGGTGGDSDTDGGSASASASATDATASATDSATSTGGVDPTAGSDVCTQYASWASDCDASYDYETALSYCNQLVASLAMDSPGCASAYEELLVCAVALDCSTLEQEDAPPECEAQAAAFDEACDFGGGSSSGG